MAIGGGEVTHNGCQILIPPHCLPHRQSSWKLLCLLWPTPVPLGNRPGTRLSGRHLPSMLHTHICCVYGFDSGSTIIKPVSLNMIAHLVIKWLPRSGTPPVWEMSSPYLCILYLIIVIIWPQAADYQPSRITSHFCLDTAGLQIDKHIVFDT